MKRLAPRPGVFLRRLREIRTWHANRHTPVKALYAPRKIGQQLVGYVCLHCGLVLTVAGNPSSPNAGHPVYGRPSKAHQERVTAARAVYTDPTLWAWLKQQWMRLWR